MPTNVDVLLCGAWDEGPGYPRTRSLRQGLAAFGACVRDCRAAGLGRGKQRLLRAPWRWPGHWLAQRRQREELLAGLATAIDERRPDVIVVPYPGHAVVRAIRRATDVPIVLDLFLSAYDTVVEDRAWVRPGSLGALWLQHLDAAACRAADLVLLDTPENAAYVQDLTGVAAERFAWLPVHDPDAPAQPLRVRAPHGGTIELLFFGTGVPLHGLATLIAAVAHVPAVRLTLVGGRAGDRAMAQARLGDRLRLEPPFVARDRLGALLAECHLVAGVFGASGKTQRVVPFKVVHALASGRPVVTADSPAVARWLEGSGAVFPVAANDVGALVAALRKLAASPELVAAATTRARSAYERHFGTARQVERWRELLSRLVGEPLSGVA
ncbi:MAG TPA: glycosyltransferase [bacterium]|nr:glycosyltransferase [bacterium]